MPCRRRAPVHRPGPPHPVTSGPNGPSRIGREADAREAPHFVGSHGQRWVLADNTCLAGPRPNGGRGHVTTLRTRATNHRWYRLGIVLVLVLLLCRPLLQALPAEAAAPPPAECEGRVV